MTCSGKGSVQAFPPLPPSSFVSPDTCDIEMWFGIAGFFTAQTGRQVRLLGSKLIV